MALIRFALLLLAFSAVGLCEAAPPPWAGPNAGAEFVQGEVVVKFKEEARSSRKDLFSVANVTLKKVRELAFGAELWRIEEASSRGGSEWVRQNLSQKTLDVVDSLRLHADVQYAHRNAVFELFGDAHDEFYSLQWNLATVNFPKAMDHASGGATVAVIDTGRLDHPDLVGKWLPGIDATIDPFGSNSYDNSGNVWHHGIHVAGVIAANTALSNSGDIRGTAGICPQCKIIPVKIVQSNGSIVSISSALLPAAIKWSVDNGARVINMSFGTGNRHSPCVSEEYQDLQDAFDYAASHGVVTVAAAGNHSRNVADITPASCRGVIAVAASDRNGQLAPYSNRGSRIDVTAPGGGGSGTGMYGDGLGCSVPPTCPDGNTCPYSGTMGVVSSWVVEKPSGLSGTDYCYRYLSGTSMAAPHVAGLVALMLSKAPTLTPAQVLQRLKRTAKPVMGCVVGQCGAGIIDAGGALAGLSSMPAVFLLLRESCDSSESPSCI